MKRRPPVTDVARWFGFTLGVLAIALVAALVSYAFDPPQKSEPCKSVPYAADDRGASCFTVEKSPE